jgi:hypothetical protein
MDLAALGPLGSRYINVSDLPWKLTGHPGVEMKVLREEKESGLPRGVAVGSHSRSPRAEEDHPAAVGSPRERASAGRP